MTTLITKTLVQLDPEDCDLCQTDENGQFTILFLGKTPLGWEHFYWSGTLFINDKEQAQVFQDKAEVTIYRKILDVIVSLRKLQKKGEYPMERLEAAAALVLNELECFQSMYQLHFKKG